VRAMAKRLNTDPATVVRIVRSLEFASYREFQRHLHDLSIAFATSLDTMQQSGNSTSMPTHVREALEQDLKNLHGLKNSLDVARLVALAKRLYDARRIVILAGDLAAFLADYLEYQITLLGLPVFNATTAGRIAHLVRSVNKQDLVLAISFRRGLRQTVEGVHSAHERGAYCVGIADTYVSPLARECDEVFLASVESTSFGASYAAPTALVNAILAALGQYRRPQTMASLRKFPKSSAKASAGIRSNRIAALFRGRAFPHVLENICKAQQMFLQRPSSCIEPRK
jgi:DNA-binding MurR/RpiR family transcriptional regulator